MNCERVEFIAQMANHYCASIFRHSHTYQLTHSDVSTYVKHSTWSAYNCFCQNVSVQRWRVRVEADILPLLHTNKWGSISLLFGCFKFHWGQGCSFGSDIQPHTWPAYNCFRSPHPTRDLHTMDSGRSRHPAYDQNGR